MVRACNGESGRCGTALLSVHSDDIVLAVHNLKRLFPRPWTLVTVFSNSHFTKQRPKNSDSIRAAREFEDVIYCQREGMAYVGLGFEDRPDVVASDHSFRAHVMSAVRDALAQLVDELQPQFVLAPLCVRNGRQRIHAHHAIVSDAAIGVMGSKSRTTLALFDEVCYSRLPLEEIPHVNGAAYIPHVVQLGDQALAEKLESMRIYGTQELSRLDGFVRAVGKEVVRLPCVGFHVEPRNSDSSLANPGSRPVAPAVVRTSRCIAGLSGRGRPHGPPRNCESGDRHSGVGRRRGHVVEMRPNPRLRTENKETPK